MTDDIKEKLKEYYTRCRFEVIDLNYNNYKIILYTKILNGYIIDEVAIDFNFKYDKKLSLEANLSQIKYKIEKEFVKIIIKGGKK